MPQAFANWDILLSLLGAFLLALPVGWERERRTRLAGLRTFPITSLGSCAFILASAQFTHESPDAQARIAQGLITGVGFIGGGAILKGKGSVTGTATAASLWATGAIGMASAYQRWDVAIPISLGIFLTLRLLTTVEHRMGWAPEDEQRAAEARGETDEEEGEDEEEETARRQEERNPPT